MAVLTAGVRNADVVSLTPLKMVKLRAGAYLELLPQSLLCPCGSSRPWRACRGTPHPARTFTQLREPGMVSGDP